MKNIQIALLLLLIGFVLGLLSMVLGPLGWETASITSGVIAAGFALIALFFALRAHRNSQESSR